ncbi:uncharacterized protein [Chelonus insularis]|uniref:uncharacterized protein n=1 Tax=Chelonus insularis TaxID=460826 RepID=UPI00158B7F85|nr:uncharacterized protein LOC118072983 [Chelonus insularis]
MRKPIWGPIRYPVGRIKRSFQPEETVPILPDDMPLKLKNRVASKGSATQEKGCFQEIVVAITCLSANNFENKECLKEIKDYQDCFKLHLANKAKTKEEIKSGKLIPGSKHLKFNQLNQLLSRYPQQ